MTAMTGIDAAARAPPRSAPSAAAGAVAGPATRLAGLPAPACSRAAGERFSLRESAMPPMAPPASELESFLKDSFKEEVKTEDAGAQCEPSWSDLKSNTSTGDIAGKSEARMRKLEHKLAVIRGFWQIRLYFPYLPFCLNRCALFPSRTR